MADVRCREGLQLFLRAIALPRQLERHLRAEMAYLAPLTLGLEANANRTGAEFAAVRDAAGLHCAAGPAPMSLCALPHLNICVAGRAPASSTVTRHEASAARDASTAAMAERVAVPDSLLLDRFGMLRAFPKGNGSSACPRIC
jgi:hypothetical protein